MPVRIVIGVLVTVVGFGIAARRFHWLSRLIRSGKKDPNRSRGPIRFKVEAETTEVAGQRKLLQWTVPGLAHFFTMWGFTILLLTIIEAYGDLFNIYFHIPLIGTWNWVGFIEDFFACANQLGIPREEAGAYIRKYFERFPGIRDYMESTKKRARADGYVKTIFGRKCHFPRINA